HRAARTTPSRSRGPSRGTGSPSEAGSPASPRPTPPPTPHPTCHQPAPAHTRQETPPRPPARPYEPPAHPAGPDTRPDPAAGNRHPGRAQPEADQPPGPPPCSSTAAGTPAPFVEDHRSHPGRSTSSSNRYGPPEHAGLDTSPHPADPPAPGEHTASTSSRTPCRRGVAASSRNTSGHRH